MEAKAFPANGNAEGVGEEVDREDEGMGGEAMMESQGQSATEEQLHRSLSAVDRQYAVQPDLPRRIHIVGTGSIGKLVAHSLRGIANPPPITLIFHRYKLLKAWEESRKEITIQDDEYKVPRGGFDVELAPERLQQHGAEIPKDQPEVYDYGDNIRPHEAAEIIKRSTSRDAARRRKEGGDDTATTSQRRARAGDYAISREPIHNLIVTTKAALTVPALSAIRDRLSASTTICFLQNGMGIIDAVNEQLFPHPADRPNYVQGIVSHGVNVPPAVAARDPFFAVHAGHGTIALGLLPRDDNAPPSGAAVSRPPAPEKWPPSARHLLRTLTRTPVLSAVGFTPLELLQLQLEKLAVNSILNPLTTLLDARNGALLSNFALTRTMRLLLAETSLIIRSLPELAGVPNTHTRFSAQRLETLTVSVANKTAENISSMLADVRAGRRTEVEYINGWIVRKGEEVGVKAVVNYAIMQTVIGKSAITQRELRDAVPFQT